MVRLLSKGPRCPRTSWLQPAALRWLVKSELNSVTACNAHKVRRCGYTTCCNNPCCWRRRAKTESFYKHSQHACAAQRGKTERCGSPGGRQATPALLLGPLLAKKDFCWPVCYAYVYKAITGQTGMGPAMFFRLGTLADMQWSLNMMTALAEADQRKKDKVLLVAVDASESAYATYTPNGGFQ